MKPKKISDIKKALKLLSEQELMTVIQKLAAFKVENKDLLTYLLFYKNAEQTYTDEMINQLSNDFQELNKSNAYYIRKGLRKLEKKLNKHARILKNGHMEIQIWIAFLRHFKQEIAPDHRRQLSKLQERLFIKAEKKICDLHPDLQYDYKKELNTLFN